MNAFSSLTETRRWVGWRNEPKPNGELTKVPRDPKSGEYAKCDDPTTWGTHVQAECWAKRNVNGVGGGVGIQLGDIGNGEALAGVDLDTCRNPDGTFVPWAQNILDSLDTYAEVSPSGTGAKAFCRVGNGDAARVRAAMDTPNGRRWAFEPGKHPSGIEIAVGGKYFTVTGEHIATSPADIRLVRAHVFEGLIRLAERKRGTPPAAPGLCQEAGALGDELPTRIEAAARQDATLARRWGGDWTGVKDKSRSGKAYALGAALKGAGFTASDVSAALRHHDDTADWSREAGQRGLKRVWENAPEAGDNDDASWPVPDVALATADIAPAPPLPLDVFPTAWAEWIRDAANGAGAPPDYVAAGLLSVAGALIGNARWASPKQGWREPPILNVALVGRPSAGKSPALDTIINAVREIERELDGDWDERRRDYATKKATAECAQGIWKDEVKKAAKSGHTPPRQPDTAVDPDAPERRRIISNDTTTEKAVRLSAANPRGLLNYRDELAGWIAGMDRYGGGAGGSDRAFWLEAFGGRPFVQDRVKDADKSVAVPNLTWGIIGGIQPDRLSTLLMAGDDDGLAARFLYVWPEPVQPVWTQGSDIRRARGWLWRLRALPWDEQEPEALQFSADACRILQFWREDVARTETSASGLFLSWLGKLPGYAIRLAVVFAHLEWCATGADTAPPDVVAESHVRRAVEILADYFVPMSKRAFGEAKLPEAERDARRLARWLLEQRPRPERINVRELRRMADGPGIATPARIEAALTELEALGWVRLALPNRAGQGGRSRNDWDVNPYLARAGRDVA